jgi:AcrR family transcriptional regulator
MTYPPTTSEEPLASTSTDPPIAILGAIAGTASEQPPLEFVEATRVDQSGRPLGPRAMRTRARILEATVAILDEKSMRDLRVIDIARRIGSSPATFYQYFKDVKDVVLELATEVSDFTPEMIELIQGDWHGRAGHERGIRLVNLVIDNWDRYKAILRVRNNAADEGDPEFMEVRRKAMFPMVRALAEALTMAHEAAGTDRVENREWAGGTISPLAGAMLLFAGLEGAAMYHEIFTQRFGPEGEGREDIVTSAATLLQTVLTSPR